jgi:hypothetical protein
MSSALAGAPSGTGVFAAPLRLQLYLNQLVPRITRGRDETLGELRLTSFLERFSAQSHEFGPARPFWPASVTLCGETP